MRGSETSSGIPGCQRPRVWLYHKVFPILLRNCSCFFQVFFLACLLIHSVESCLVLKSPILHFCLQAVFFVLFLFNFQRVFVYCRPVCLRWTFLGFLALFFGFVVCLSTKDCSCPLVYSVFFDSACLGQFQFVCTIGLGIFQACFMSFHPKFACFQCLGFA